jgi:carboxyl-terminal processing protease
MTRRSVVVLVTAIIICGLCAVRAEYEPYPRFFAQVMRRIDRDYVEKIPPQTIFDGAMEGIVTKLDRYSDFTTWQQTNRLEEMFEQKFGGIGVQLSERAEQGIVIHSPMLHSPAFRAGLRSGDRIVEIEGEDSRAFTLEQAHNRLIGDPGQAVNISIERPGSDSPLKMQLVRDYIGVDSVTGLTRLPDNRWNWWIPGVDRVAYVRLQQFEKHTTDEFEAALAEIMPLSPRGIVIDVRDNPGGLLSGAVQVCEQFLGKGKKIVSTRGRDRRELDAHYVTESPPYPDVPLVVLINPYSASAAEIVAACLQDHQRATLVGKRTWGKGTVQHLIETEGGRSRLRLTVATYWRPSGKNIHRLKEKEDDADGEWGVHPSPDCEVDITDAEAEKLRDALRQLQIVRQPDEPPTEPAGVSLLELDPQLRKAVEQFGAASK